jgi:hypothetical protein
MGWWKEVPFRGDGKSSNKPRRRFVNIKSNRRETIVSILIVLGLFVIPFGCLFIFGQAPSDNGTELGGAVIGLLFLLIFSIGIASINKIRKGYDIEIPDEQENQNSKGSNKHKNIID